MKTWEKAFWTLCLTTWVAIFSFIGYLVTKNDDLLVLACAFLLPTVCSGLIIGTFGAFLLALLSGGTSTPNQIFPSPYE